MEEIASVVCKESMGKTQDMSLSGHPVSQRDKLKTMDAAKVIELEELDRNSIIDETIAKGNSPVQEFYRDAVVFVTGGSGFLGKQLIEKLFRSCQIRKMYVFLRAKKQKPVQERLDEFLKDMLYDKLHKTQPDFTKKIIPVEGNICELGLGIDTNTRKMLIEEVNVIFHGAATVSFVEPLKVATLTNVRGTREILLLAKECRNLKSIVHISTAYSHATYSRVNQNVFEQFYPSPVDPEFLINLVEKLDDRSLEVMTPNLINDWPNTYSYTKAVAEEMVRTIAGDLPICIVRPAIVLGAYREPPGWVDKTTINGPVGFILGAALGGLHVIYADPENNLEAIPVDFVNNTVIAAGKETSDRKARGETYMKIYTSAVPRNTCKIDKVHQLLDSDIAYNLATPRVLWYGFCTITKSKALFLLISTLLHFIPGYLIDGVFMLCGKKPKVTRLFKKAYKMNTVYSYYLLNKWRFDDSNTYKLHQNLSKEDQVVYYCDSGDENPAHNPMRYLTISIIGIRKYILKDGLEGTDYAMKKLVVFRILNVLYLAGYAYLLWKLFLLFCYLCNSIFALFF